MKTFARIIDHPDTQILITKSHVKSTFIVRVSFMHEDTLMEITRHCTDLYIQDKLYDDNKYWVSRVNERLDMYRS